MLPSVTTDGDGNSDGERDRDRDRDGETDLAELRCAGLVEHCLAVRAEQQQERVRHLAAGFAAFRCSGGCIALNTPRGYDVI